MLSLLKLFSLSPYMEALPLRPQLPPEMPKCCHILWSKVTNSSKSVQPKNLSHLSVSKPGFEPTLTCTCLHVELSDSAAGNIHFTLYKKMTDSAIYLISFNFTDHLLPERINHRDLSKRIDKSHPPTIFCKQVKIGLRNEQTFAVDAQPLCRNPCFAMIA